MFVCHVCICTYAYEYSNMRNTVYVIIELSVNIRILLCIVSLVDYNAFEYSITVLQL